MREGYIYDYVFDWTVLKHQQDEEKERQTSGVSRSSGREREGRDRGRDRDAVPELKQAQFESLSDCGKRLLRHCAIADG